VWQGLCNDTMSVHPSVYLSHLSAACHLSGFAAVGPAGRRCRLTAAAARRPAARRSAANVSSVTLSAGIGSCEHRLVIINAKNI